MPLERWNDGRLDDLHRTVINMAIKVESVSRLEERTAGFAVVVERLEKAITALTDRLDDVTTASLRRAALVRDQAKLAVFAAIAGAVAVFVATKLAGG